MDLDHEKYMHLALNEARKSPPRPTNFRVGAVLVNGTTGEVLSTGYTLELPGNTHAEQCALSKFAQLHNLPFERVGEALRPELAAVIYTTMEPCVERLSGNLPCVDRILQTQTIDCGGIRRVFTGVKEPDIFVKGNSGRAKLERAGIQCILVPGFEKEALEVAKAGHK